MYPCQNISYIGWIWSKKTSARYQANISKRFSTQFLSYWGYVYGF